MSGAIGLSYQIIARQNGFKRTDNQQIMISSYGTSETNFYVPMLQIRNKEVIIFNYWAGVRGARGEDEEAKMNERMEAARSVAYAGQITQGSEKRLRRALSLLLQSSPERVIYNPVSNSHHPFKINFITLTCSDKSIHKHRELQKTLLEPYLRWQRSRGAKSYIWKVELQERGQPHYHITTNTFIHFQDIQDQWNSLQRKAGYLEAYAKKNKHYRANSTDVHSVKTIKDLEAYLVKYVVKESLDPLPGGGKIWDCSTNLKTNYFYTEMTQTNYDRLRSYATQYKELEHCAFAKVSDPTRILDSIQSSEYQQFITSLNK